jgi:branched-chain amino acid transport system ATP-binding protein
LEKREVLLKLNNIETYYQDVIEAIRGVSLEVKENSIVCVLGANGAGKTTLLRTIARLLDDEPLSFQASELRGKNLRN